MDDLTSATREICIDPSPPPFSPPCSPGPPVVPPMLIQTIRESCLDQQHKDAYITGARHLRATIVRSSRESEQHKIAEETLEKSTIDFWAEVEQMQSSTTGSGPSVHSVAEDMEKMALSSVDDMDCQRHPQLDKDSIGGTHPNASTMENAMSNLCLGQEAIQQKAPTTADTKIESSYSVSLGILYYDTIYSSPLSSATKDLYLQRLATIFEKLDRAHEQVLLGNGDGTHQALLLEWFDLGDEFYAEPEWNEASQDINGDEGQSALADYYRGKMEESMRTVEGTMGTFDVADEAMGATEGRAFDVFAEEDFSMAH